MRRKGCTDTLHRLSTENVLGLSCKNVSSRGDCLDTGRCMFNRCDKIVNETGCFGKNLCTTNIKSCYFGRHIDFDEEVFCGC